MAGDSIDVVSVAEVGGNPDAAAKPRLAVAKSQRNFARTPQIVGAAIAVFLILGFVLFRSTGQDDSYITYWPAYALAKYGHIINYSGESVEQSSSLLLVILLGLLAAITRLPVPLLGPLISILGGILAIVVTSRLAARLDRRVHPYAIFFTATATYLMYWSFSGMEMSLAAACVAWLALNFADYVAGAPTRKVEIGAAAACVLMVRPEACPVLVLTLAGLVVVLWLRRRQALLPAETFRILAKRVGHLALLVIGIAIALAAVRLGLFHSPMPEPVLAKGGRQSHLTQGLTYLITTITKWYILPAAILALAGIVATLREAVTAQALNLTRLVCAVLVAAYCCFVVWVGGDWMLAGRFLVPALPTAFFMAAYALGRFAPSRFLQAIGTVVVVVQVCGLILYARKTSVAASSGSDVQAAADLSWFDRSNRLFLRDVPAAAALDRVVTRMVASGHPVAHLLSGQMGFVMYQLGARHKGQIDVTDRHGLADQRLVDCSLANTQKRLLNGLSVDYLWFLTHQKQLEQVCHIPSPDIIYDIEGATSLARAGAVQKHGYALVYHKVCDVPPNHGLLRGDTIPVDEFIAVRKDLFPALKMRELPLNQPDDGTL